jgi:hypothetical protein
MTSPEQNRQLIEAFWRDLYQRDFDRLTGAAAILLLVVGLLSGCAVVPYEFGVDLETPRTLELAEDEPQIERGHPHAWLDGFGHYVFSLPVKLLLLSWRVDNHAISEETEAAIAQYLAENGLENVKVRINQYAPSGEWDRLFANRDIHGFWRYTVGALTVAVYTVFPQRLFGGDNYNPFTNSIHLYSDLRAIALHEAGHAKDFTARGWKGAYSTARVLPLVPLYQEAVATGDAIGYERVKSNSEGEKRAYRVLYPAYGTYVGGEAVQWIPVGATWVAYAIQFGAVIPGHIIGWTRSLFVEDQGASAIELELIPPPSTAPAEEGPSTAPPEEDALPEALEEGLGPGAKLPDTARGQIVALEDEQGYAQILLE